MMCYFLYLLYSKSRGRDLFCKGSLWCVSSYSAGTDEADPRSPSKRRGAAEKSIPLERRSYIKATAAHCRRRGFIVNLIQNPISEVELIIGWRPPGLRRPLPRLTRTSGFIFSHPSVSLSTSLVRFRQMPLQNVHAQQTSEVRTPDPHGS